MFQLDPAVQTWREGMLQHGNVAAADIDELESHVRDDIDQLAGKALSIEEAFLIAVHRLGTPPELAAEYGKIHTGRIWTRRLFWMLSGYMAVSLTISAISAVGQWMSAGAMVSGLVVTPRSYIALLASLLGVALLGIVLLAVLPEGRRLLTRMADRILFWGRYHPLVLMMGAYVLYIGIRASSMGRNVVLSQFTSAEMMGQFLLAGAYFSMATLMILPAVVLILCGWTYRILHRPAATSM